MRLRLLLRLAVAVSSWLLLGAVAVYAQGFESEELPSRAEHASSEWYRELHSDTPNVYRIRTLLQHDPSIRAGERSREWKQAVRWLAEHWHLASADGDLKAEIGNPTLITLPTLKERDALQGVAWSCLGPFTWDRDARSATGSMGIGVIRSIDVHPDHPDTIVVGTISAGVWLSEDGGTSWKNVTDPLPVTTVWNVAIARSDPSLVYAATNIGLVRSIDGGKTFEATAWCDPNGYPEARRVDDLAVDPRNPFTLIIASEGGLRRTRDAGVTWTEVEGATGRFWDLAWHPQDRSIVYALRNDGTWVTFLRSTDGGRSFAPSGTGLPVDPSQGRIPRGRLAVSPDRPSMVWVLLGGTADTVGGVWGLYRSADRGVSYSHVCCGDLDGPEPPNTVSNPNLFDYAVDGTGIGQLTWDMIFAVSPADTSLMVAGGIFPYTSTDGGRTWQRTQAIHYDVQDACFADGTMWVAHDGGVHRSTDHGATMEDRSDGINSLQVWGFGRSHRSDVMAVGAYHMPVFLRDDRIYDAGGFPGGWYAWSGADAMAADVNPDDDRWVYAKPWTSVRAERTSSKDLAPQGTDLGIDLGYISLSNLAFHPNETYTIVAADHTTNSVVRTRSNTERWETLYTFKDWISRVRVDQRDPNVLLAIGDNRVIRSVDGGRTWSDIRPTVGASERLGLVDVVFGADPADLWVAVGGRQSDGKVYHSTDAGQTWTEEGIGLPSLAMRCLVVQEGADGRLYAGTEDGIYTRNATEPTWVRYGTGLPFTSVSFLHIDAVDGQLQAGTERGIWQAPLAETSRPIARIARDRDTLRCTRTPVRFSDRSVLVATMDAARQWRFPGGQPETSTDAVVQVTYDQPGVYEAQLIVTDGQRADTMVLTNAVTVLPSECDGVDPEPGQAIDLTRNDDHVRLGRLDTTVSSFTFMAWVKPKGAQPDFSAIFCTDGPGNPKEIGMQFFAPDNQIGYLWSGGRWWWKSGLKLEPDQWSHVAMMVSPTHATVMVNGKAATDSIALDPIDLSELDVMLGTYHFWETRNAAIEIDEVRMYDRALSVDEVRATMHHPIATTEPGLLAWYQANESGGMVLYDKHRGAPGHLESGARRMVSTIPFGIGTTQVLTDLAATWVAFEFTGLDLSLRAEVPTEIMTTRILRQPDSLLTSQTLLAGYWLVRAIDDTADVVNSVRASLRGQIGWEDGGSRRYTMWMRDVNDHRSSWNTDLSLASSPASYDPRTQTIRGWLNRSIPAAYQLAFTVEGGPVGVEQVGGVTRAFRVWPVPASDRLTIESDRPIHQVAVFDLHGQALEVSTHVSDHNATLNLSPLPSGTYVVVVDGERRLVPVVR